MCRNDAQVKVVKSVALGAATKWNEMPKVNNAKWNGNEQDTDSDSDDDDDGDKVYC